VSRIDLDPALVSRFKETSVPTVVDILDYEFGVRSWLPHAVKPIFRTRIAGRAVTVLIVPAPRGGADHLFDAVDACGPGSILVATNGGDTAISCMGDLVVTALHARGAEGAVMDGAVRDIDPMIEMGFPIFAASVSPVNFTGKASVLAHEVPIICGGVPVHPGDVVLADWDGVVIIPQEHAAAVLPLALEKEAAEHALRERIREHAASTPLATLFAEAEHVYAGDEEPAAE
jgi:4-hydroxy-4-methyl-2-oxoglutarate aldolase